MHYSQRKTQRRFICFLLAILAAVVSVSYGQRTDTSTLTGKVMCGYQGWFTTPSDGAQRGWRHWGQGGRFEPGACTIDIWPDMSEYSASEKYATSFRHGDGSVARVFSSYNRRTVFRHFGWMQEYGIDGAFMQRFASEVFGKSGLNHFDTVLKNARSAANHHGRAYAVMYDLSGMRKGQMPRLIEDFKHLVDDLGITKRPTDKAYLHHKGKPVVAIWGIGFSGGRDYTLDECLQLVNFLKNDKKYGGCTVMLGVPTFWRTLRRDCLDDPKVHEIVKAADIVSPWMVGRFRKPEDVPRFADEVWAKDIEWCDKYDKDYLPVLWPGFSWANLERDPGQFNKIPRLGGRFLWKQYTEAKEAGATMIYQAMFDEVDEATAIFKCTNDPPVGKSRFLTYEGLPTDHYLWLTGQGGRLVRGEIKLSDELPERK
jgi:hypothetical protein